MCDGPVTGFTSPVSRLGNYAMEGSVEERRAGEMVREYLRYHGYRNTLQCIQAEAHQQRRPVAS